LVEPSKNTGKLELRLLRIGLEFTRFLELDSGFFRFVEPGEHKSVVIAGRVVLWIRIDRQAEIRGSLFIFGSSPIRDAPKIARFQITRLMRDDLGKKRQGVGLAIQADESFCQREPGDVGRLKSERGAEVPERLFITFFAAIQRSETRAYNGGARVGCRRF